MVVFYNCLLNMFAICSAVAAVFVLHVIVVLLVNVPFFLEIIVYCLLECVWVVSLIPMFYPYNCLCIYKSGVISAFFAVKE